MPRLLAGLDKTGVKGSKIRLHPSCGFTAAWGRELMLVLRCLCPAAILAEKAGH